MNRDGALDKIYTFDYEETTLEEGAQVATLTAELVDGRHITGVDIITVTIRRGVRPPID